MKRFFLVCSLWLIGSVPVNAADYLNGDWFILTGSNGVSTTDPTADVAKDIAKQKDLKCVAFTAQCNWAFLFGGNGVFYSGGMADSLVAKITELWKITGDFRCLAFRPQGGWVLLYDKNGFAQDGIPATATAQLEQAQKANSTFRSMAFTPDGGWLLLLEQDFQAEGIPNDLKQRLTDHYKKRIPIRCVSFTSQGDWFLLDEHNDCFSNNTEHPAYKKLTELRGKGEKLQWIAFTPGEYTHGYVLEHLPVQRVKAVMSLKFDRPEGGVNLWTVLPPQTPELPRQRDVKLTLEPASITVPDTGPFKQSVLMSRVTDQPKGFTAKATYELTLYTNRLVPRLAGQPAGKAHLTPELFAAFTHLTDDVKSKVFQGFLDKAKLRRAPKESDLALARRTFLYVSKNFQYLYPNPEGTDVVEVGKGDCGGLSWVFVRTLRANGVPARLIVGRWASSEVPAKDGQPINPQYHVKGEVFIDGLGWVGADLSGGVGVAGNPFVCFGTEPGDFVVLELDGDRVVEVFAGQKPLNLGCSQGFFWWWSTSVVGKDPQLEDHWTLEVLDRHPAHTSVRPSWKRPPVSGPYRPAKPVVHVPIKKATDTPAIPAVPKPPSPEVKPPSHEIKPPTPEVKTPSPEAKAPTPPEKSETATPTVSTEPTPLPRVTDLSPPVETTPKPEEKDDPPVHPTQTQDVDPEHVIVMLVVGSVVGAVVVLIGFVALKRRLSPQDGR